VSGPVQIPLGDKVWYVHNYENSDLGRISLASATEFSDNTVYAQLTQLVGPAAIVRTAKRLGITSPLKKYFAIGLGAEAVNPLEMARAFSTFANQGRRVDGAVFGNRPRAISVVRNETGRIVDDNRAIQRPVLTENTAASSPRCCTTSSPEAPASGAAPDGRPSPARRERPRTTATPGSATHRSSSRRVGRLPNTRGRC
jgi:membrane peptidoglycan carboxypeptidase